MSSKAHLYLSEDWHFEIYVETNRSVVSFGTHRGYDTHVLINFELIKRFVLSEDFLKIELHKEDREFGKHVKFYLGGVSEIECDSEGIGFWIKGDSHLAQKLSNKDFKYFSTEKFN